MTTRYLSPDRMIIEQKLRLKILLYRETCLLRSLKANRSSGCIPIRGSKTGPSASSIENSPAGVDQTIGRCMLQEKTIPGSEATGVVVLLLLGDQVNRPFAQTTLDQPLSRTSALGLPGISAQQDQRPLADPCISGETPVILLEHFQYPYPPFYRVLH